jgi:hypothetical protein
MASLQLKDSHQMLDRGYATTDKFKTRQKFQLQPVTLSLECTSIFQFYLKHIRPQVARSSDPEDPLWLSYNGKIGKPGLCVKNFFKKTMQLTISTTGIRDLVETEVAKLSDQGRISTSVRNAVMSINGHGGQTTQDYYIQRTKFGDVRQAQVAFRAMGANDNVAVDETVDAVDIVEQPFLDDYQHQPPSPAHDEQPPQLLPLVPPAAPRFQPLPLGMEVPVPLYPHNYQPPVQEAPAQDRNHLSFQQLLARWEANDAVTAIDWGNGRADYGQPNLQRAEWSNEEILYVGTFCEEELARRGTDKANVVSVCLKHIYGDPNAIPIFHPNHVLDCSRLRHAWRSWPALKAKLLSQK